jgi:hypothetical protein
VDRELKAFIDEETAALEARGAELLKQYRLFYDDSVKVELKRNTLEVKAYKLAKKGASLDDRAHLQFNMNLRRLIYAAEAIRKETPPEMAAQKIIAALKEFTFVNTDIYQFLDDGGRKV